MKKSLKTKKQLINAEDVCRLKVPISAAISPDEKKVAYTVESVSKDKKEYYSHIFLTKLAKEEIRQFTFGKINDRELVWSPDGKQIAFISTRNKKTGIYIIPTEGGAERKIIEEDGAFTGLKWTPDGQEIVYSFRYNDSFWEKDKKKKKEPPLYRHITRLFYRLDGAGFVPKDRFHIWKLSIETRQTKQLTKGNFDERTPNISPNGKSIVFISNRKVNSDLDYLYDDLFIIPINGSKIKKIKTPPGPIASPTFSPDGKKIAYVGHDNPNDCWGVTNWHLWTVGASGRPAAKNLTPKFDRLAFDTTIGDVGGAFEAPPLFWSPDGKKIYFTVTDTGSTHIFYAPSSGGRPTRVTHKKCHVRSYHMNGKRRLISAIVSNLQNPGNLQLMPSVYEGDSKAKLLDNPAKKLLSKRDIPKTREIWFNTHDGFKLQGWLVTPPKFNKNRKYPAILEIHGGPRAQYGFTFFHEMLYLASKGYVVFYTNPRGGTGRGETFADAITGGWGDIDYYDCMSAADYLEKLPYVNKNKIGVTGGSYGGYMTNWIVGHTNRFKAAITQRSVV
ncbi:MAG: S9 family peptidase, partial [candidate division Zixibacteria bacterium]|nr:S9 family peptidase [candidate division Zixibacteria bacterium]